MNLAHLPLHRLFTDGSQLLEESTRLEDRDHIIHVSNKGLQAILQDEISTKTEAVTIPKPTKPITLYIRCLTSLHLIDKWMHEP